MFFCTMCFETFDHPRIYHYDENLDGENGRMHWRVPLCPWCGSEEIEEREEGDEDDDL